MNGNGILLGILFAPFLAALLIALLGERNEKIRDLAACTFGVLEFAGMVFLAVRNLEAMEAGGVLKYYVNQICGFGLSFQLDGFRLLYGSIAVFMWMMATILSGEYFKHHENRNRFYVFLMMTLGATLGVFFSQDLYTTFLFFEIMSFTSYVWVAQEESREALKAAGTYLAVAVTGGMVMLMGIFLVYHELGTLDFDGMAQAAVIYPRQDLLFAAGLCMLFGFGAKAGAFPLHIWLPKAHPVAPAPASALLSGILTKTGIFGILVLTTRLFYGNMNWGILLLGIGVLTMFGGAFLAVFSIDLKRTLACSSMSQIGFILVGVGMQALLGEENALAVHGTVLHMANHSLIKLVLFLAAGVIYWNTHSLDLNQIRGFGRKKPLLKGIFLVGALAIAGIPFFGGYVSKTLLHESILEYGSTPWIKAVEVIFLFSGGLTLAYMTKLFAAIFLEKNQDEKRQAEYDANHRYMNPASGFAVTGSALLLLVWGLFPHQLMDRAAELSQSFLGLEETGHEVEYFAWENLKGALVTLIVGGLVYGVVIRLILRSKDGKDRNCWPSWLDLEELLYRPLLFTVLPLTGGILCRITDSLVDGMVVLLRKTIYRDSPLPADRREGNVFTETAGKFWNLVDSLKRRKKTAAGEKTDYVHAFAMKYAEWTEDERIITRSLSFGLLLFGIGLSLTLIYILF